MASRCRSLWTRLLAGFSRHIGCHRCGCLAIWRSTEPKHLARALDAHRADCGCERWSLRGLFRRRVFDQELIIRVITSPDGYDTETKEILTRKLTALYSSGVSILRESSSEDEIRLTVSELTSGGAEPQSLVGAVVLTASQVRQLDPRQRGYCIYDTHAPRRRCHADMFGTFPVQGSNKERERFKERRRYALRDLMAAHLLEADTIEKLIAAVQAARNR